MLDDRRLSAAVGEIAARRLGLAEPSLESGSEADLILVQRPVPEARAEDVLLVLAGGTPRVAHPSLAPMLNPFVRHAENKTVGAVVRWTTDAAAMGTALQ